VPHRDPVSGLVEVPATWRAMQRFTEERAAVTPDEIWFLSASAASPGVNRDRAHLLTGDIPGCTSTAAARYHHGPGQLLVYPLVISEARVSRSETSSGAGARASSIWRPVRHPRRVPAQRPSVCTSTAASSRASRARAPRALSGLAVNVALDLEPSAASSVPSPLQTQLAELGGNWHRQRLRACARAHCCVRAATPRTSESRATDIGPPRQR